VQYVLQALLVLFGAALRNLVDDCLLPTECSLAQLVRLQIDQLSDAQCRLCRQAGDQCSWLGLESGAVGTGAVAASRRRFGSFDQDVLFICSEEGCLL